jgi:hypothetical protein
MIRFRPASPPSHRRVHPGLRARLRASAERRGTLAAIQIEELLPMRAPASVCGLWLGAHSLCAVIIEEGGQTRLPVTGPCTPEACASVLAWLATSEVHTLVLTERAEALIAQAHAARLCVELVPHPLLEAIRSAAGLTQRAPCHSAALLARWYFTPGLREHLRQWREPACAAEQHPLF